MKVSANQSPAREYHDMHPPAHAVVLSIDEKSQTPALDRIRPGLPIKPGKCGTMMLDYKQHGTTTLFPALNTLDGVGARPLHAAPHPPGIHPLPQHRRARRTGRQTGPRHPRQLRRPQASQGQSLAQGVLRLCLTVAVKIGTQRL
jgi:hypothetical protein